MPIAIDMKNITQGIEVSYGERVAWLSDLSKETHNSLNAFHQQHRKMASDLWEFLSADRRQRQKLAASLLVENQTELKAMADKLADFLGDSTSAIKAETAALIGQIRKFIASVKTENSELKQEIGNLLSLFHAGHQAMAKDLRKSLASETNRRHQKVKEIRTANRSDHSQARQHWQNLARIMAAKRAGKAVTAAKKIEGEFKQDTAEAKTIIADVVSAVKLKEQMMRLISAATSGVSLSRMGKTLGIPYIRLAKPASELVKQGEIKKQDSKYLKA